MKVINLFAGPGAGKSTTAAGLFYKMKRNGISVEIVTEYAKDVVWDNAVDKLKDQLYIFAKQNHKLERLKGKVDYVITDSPLLLSHYYGGKYSPQWTLHLASALLSVFNSWDNINILLERTKKFNPIGRLGSEEDAREADKGIRNLLKTHTKNYIEIEESETTVDEILHKVLNNEEY